MKGIVKDRMAGLIILPFLFAFVSCHLNSHLTNRGSHAGDVPDESSLMVLDGYFTWRRTR